MDIKRDGIVDALNALDPPLTATERKIFEAFMSRSPPALTAAMLARAMGNRLAAGLGVEADGYRVLASGDRMGSAIEGDDFIWILYPELAAALEVVLGVVAGGESATSLRDLLDEDDVERVFPEGGKIQVVMNRYERDPAARRACIDAHGARCSVCDLDFEERYGEIGRGFIHVHHVVPLAWSAKATSSTR